MEWLETVKTWLARRPDIEFILCGGVAGLIIGWFFDSPIFGTILGMLFGGTAIVLFILWILKDFKM